VRRIRVEERREQRIGRREEQCLQVVKECVSVLVEPAERLVAHLTRKVAHSEVRHALHEERLDRLACALRARVGLSTARDCVRLLVAGGREHVLYLLGKLLVGAHGGGEARLLVEQRHDAFSLLVQHGDGRAIVLVRDRRPLDLFRLVERLLRMHDAAEKELLELLVGRVDQELLEGVVREQLEAEGVEQPDPLGRVVGGRSALSTCVLRCAFMREAIQLNAAW